MLTSKQRAFLKSKAQHLKPIFQIGANELHENNLNAILAGFNTRELLKIKVNRADKSDKNITKTVAEKIAKFTNSNIVGIIGTTIILYKMNKKLKETIDINV